MNWMETCWPTTATYLRAMKGLETRTDSPEMLGHSKTSGMDNEGQMEMETLLRQREHHHLQAATEVETA